MNEIDFYELYKTVQNCTTNLMTTCSIDGNSHLKHSILFLVLIIFQEQRGCRGIGEGGISTDTNALLFLKERLDQQRPETTSKSRESKMSPFSLFLLKRISSEVMMGLLDLILSCCRIAAFPSVLVSCLISLLLLNLEGCGFASQMV